MDKTKIFALAEKAVVKGQYDKALESFEQILRSDPFDAKALNRAADILLKKGDNPKGIEYLSRLGECYTKDGFYSKAVAIYKRILKIDTAGTKESLVGVHEKLADLYGQLGLISDAMAHFSIVVDVFDRIEDHDSLLKVLKKVSDLDPYNIDSQLKLAELFHAQKKVQESDEAFERLAEHVNAKGHMPDILRVYERWVDLGPTNYARLGELVEAYLKVGEPKKALGRIQAAFRADPRSTDVLELLSSTFNALKQPDKARAVDTELLKIYRQTEKPSAAEAVEKRLKGAMPDLPPATSSSGATARQPAIAAEDEIDPAESLIQALQLDPDERKILSECDVYSKYGLNDKAFEVLSQSLSKFSQSLAIRWKLKSVCLDRGQVEQGAHLLSEIVLLAKSKQLKAWEEVATSELRKVDPSHATLGGATNASAAATRAASKAPAHETELELIDDAEEMLQKPKSDTTQVEDISFQDFEPSEISIVLEEEVPDYSAAQRVQEIQSEDSGDAGEPLLTEDDFSPEELNQLADSLVPPKLPPDVSQPEVIEPLASGQIDEPSWLEDSSPPLELSEAPMTLAPTPISIPSDDSLSEPSSSATNVQKPAALDAEFEIRQALEEVEFFKTQGLSSEADALLKSLVVKFPGHPLLAKAAPGEAAIKGAQKLKKSTYEIEALGRKVKLNVQEDDRGMDEESFFDLGKELGEELDKEPAKFEGPAEVREVFNAFKQGVSQMVSADDWQTHFDLGVAYREMGLIDDAISEFALVGKVKGQQASSLYQIGICEVARGNFAVAKEKFDQALKAPDLMNQEKISITYELAESLLHLNDRNRAKKLFEEVKKLDPEFREVQDKIKNLA